VVAVRRAPEERGAGAGRPEERGVHCSLLVDARLGGWGFSRIYGRSSMLGPPVCTNYEVYAALSALGCPYLALLLTDFEPSDPLGEVVDSWKVWFTSYERVSYLNLSCDEAEERLERIPGFLVPTGYLCRMSDDYREELERDALEGDEEAAAELAVQRELERFFDQVETDFPDAAGIFDRNAEVLSLLGKRVRTSLSEEEHPELREWERAGIVKRESPGSAMFYVKRPELLPEELKLDHFKFWIRPFLRGLAEVLAPAYFGCVSGYVYVLFPRPLLAGANV